MKSLKTVCSLAADNEKRFQLLIKVFFIAFSFITPNLFV